MAQLWVQRGTEENGSAAASPGWVVRPMVGDAQCLRATGLAREDTERIDVPADAVAWVVRAGGTGPERWVVVGSDAVLVNGAPNLAGIKILADRDSIRVPDQSRMGEGTLLYFSSERLARVEPFPGADRPTFCARCRLPIAVGEPAVRCPGCGVWCHQQEENDLPCWTYPGSATVKGATTCPTGDYPNTLDGTYLWSPEGL